MRSFNDLRHWQVVNPLHGALGNAVLSHLARHNFLTVHPLLHSLLWDQLHLAGSKNVHHLLGHSRCRSVNNLLFERSQSTPHSGPPCCSVLPTVPIPAQWAPANTSKTIWGHLDDINRGTGKSRNCSLVLCKIWSLFEILGTSMTPLSSQILSEIRSGRTILTTTKLSFNNL